MTEPEGPFAYPLPANLDEPTEKAVTMALRLLDQVAGRLEMPTREFAPYFVEAVSLAVADMLTNLNIWLENPSNPEEVNEMVGGVLFHYLGTGRRLKDLAAAEYAQMVTDAIDTYVGKELDKQAKAVLNAFNF